MNAREIKPHRLGYGGYEPPIVCLCSGFGLGMYVPGLMIRDRIRGSGVPAVAEVFETIMSEEGLKNVEKSRKAYRKSFEVALAAQRIPTDIRTSVDPEKMGALFRLWQDFRCRRFICMSGHWVFVLNEYKKIIGDQIEADFLYVDASLAPSWRQLKKLLPSYADGYNEISLYDSEKLTIERFVSTGVDPIPYSARNGRLVVHGGGWGFGRTDSAVVALEEQGFKLDVVCHELVKDLSPRNDRRFYMDDPGWRAWHLDDKGEIGFPPFAKIYSGTEPTFKQASVQQGLYEIIREDNAIVSKPGGGTLLDSFATATPLIMLVPFGPHEVSNAKIWSTCGFGLFFEDWARTNFPMEALEEMHRNLVKSRANVVDYVSELLERSKLSLSGQRSTLC